MNLTGHISTNPLEIKELKDWRLKELLEEFKAVNEAMEIVDKNDLLKRYRAFVANEIYEYVKEKMEGTDYELKKNK